MNTEFLNCGIPLVDAVTEWLAAKAKINNEGVYSLEHILVVVPTRQSGRQLRYALAQKFKGHGLIPPSVEMATRLATPEDQSLTVASKYETAALLIQFLHSADIADKEWPALFPADVPRGKDSSVSVLSLADQLEDIWSALSAGGLLMSDVSKNEKAQNILEAATGDEVQRWVELADFENRFFEMMEAQGLRHHAKSLTLAVKDPVELPAGIERIVLPGLVDPTPVLYGVLKTYSTKNPSLEIDVLIHADKSDADKFDEWGRPRIDSWTGEKAPALSLKDEDIVLSSNAQSLADEVASNFPEADSDFELPALGLADSSLYPALEAALLSHGFSEINNPERHKLSASSLGHIVNNLITLFTSDAPEFSTFASIVRENDFLEMFGNDLRSHILKELDEYQNEFVPAEMPRSLDEVKGGGTESPKPKAQRPLAREPISPKPKAQSPLALEPMSPRALETESTALNAQPQYRFPALREAFSKIDEWRGVAAGKPVPDAVLHVLREMFEFREIGNEPGDREFAAAASAVRDVFGEMEKTAIAALPDSARLAVFRKAVSDAAYQLEPASTDVIKTEGWLELAWSPATNIIIAGFNEGKVPDSIVGHAFLPDALREALGLESNARRLARDTYLFSELIKSRRNGGRVKVFVSLADAHGDLQRPSRLLFLCSKEELPVRVKRLFGEPDAAASTPPRVLPSEWRLDFDCSVPPMPDHLSASAIDTYLKCPFTYYLENVLGMKPYVERKELQANDFGTICHDVLAEYGRDENTRDMTIEENIRKSLLAHFELLCAQRFPHPTVNVMLQLEAAKERLFSFAKWQADHMSQGWRIVDCEKLIDGVKPFADEFDVTLKGYIDRIDFNPATGKYCIIDYKTWDKLSTAKSKVASSTKRDIEFAGKMGFPVFETPGSRKGTVTANRWLTVQMEVYRELLEASGSKFAGNISEFKYAVLGSSQDETGFFGADSKFNIAENIQSARETMRRAFTLIKAGIFWPPGNSDTWEYNFGKLFLTSPDKDYAESDWVKYQEQLFSEFSQRIEF